MKAGLRLADDYHFNIYILQFVDAFCEISKLYVICSSPASVCKDPWDEKPRMRYNRLSNTWQPKRIWLKPISFFLTFSDIQVKKSSWLKPHNFTKWMRDMKLEKHYTFHQHYSSRIYQSQMLATNKSNRGPNREHRIKCKTLDPYLLR